eukprot:jgi/Ulvmu1/2264/UM013_0111.1
MAATRLTSLSIEGASATETFGHFLPKVLALPSLACLTIDTPLLDLEELPRAATWLKAEWWPRLPSLTRLCIGNTSMRAEPLMMCVPALRTLRLNGCLSRRGCTAMPLSAAAAVAACCQLSEIHLDADRADVLEAAVGNLQNAPALRTLSIAVGGAAVSRMLMSLLGALPLQELRLVSAAFHKHPTLSCLAASHVDNAAVKAYVDAVWRRCTASSRHTPLRLALCGASALTHEAVSSLLRLPALVHLDIAGCSRISAMDRMRLLAKIKAGREMHGHSTLDDGVPGETVSTSHRRAARAPPPRPLTTHPP